MLLFDFDVQPPICAAVQLSCSSDVISALLESGADVEATDKWGKTALDILEGLDEWRYADKEAVRQVLVTAGARASAVRPAAEWPAPAPWLPPQATAFDALDDFLRAGFAAAAVVAADGEPLLGEGPRAASNAAFGGA